MDNPLWQTIVDTFRTLPPDKRFSSEVAARMKERGLEVSVWRVSDVLAATVLQEMITEDEVRAAAKVLKTLVMLKSERRADEASQSDEDMKAFVWRFTRGIGYCAGMDNSAYDLDCAIADILDMYAGVQADREQLAHLKWKDYLKSLDQ